LTYCVAAVTVVLELDWDTLSDGEEVEEGFIVLASSEFKAAVVVVALPLADADPIPCNSLPFVSGGIGFNKPAVFPQQGHSYFNEFLAN